VALGFLFVSERVIKDKDGYCFVHLILKLLA
jgi:hypothetical protein